LFRTRNFPGIGPICRVLQDRHHVVVFQHDTFLLGEYHPDVPVYKLSAQDALRSQAHNHDEPRLDTKCPQLHVHRYHAPLAKRTPSGPNDLVRGSSRKANAFPIFGKYFLMNEVRPRAGVQDGADGDHDDCINSYSGGDLIIATDK
jgi:hypothetical protein